MALKRKRSSAAFATAIDFNTTSCAQWTESPSRMPFFFTQSKPIEISRDSLRDWKLEEQCQSKHLNSRTQKRHRDNRPDENQVHTNTMHILFDAQKQRPNASPVLSQPQPAVQPRPAQNQKSTLHAFWQLPSRPITTKTMQMDIPQITTAESLTCDDCDRPLLSVDAMDIDNAVLEHESMCGACGKHVCNNCAVLADQRRCLDCATHGV